LPEILSRKQLVGVAMAPPPEISFTAIVREAESQSTMSRWTVANDLSRLKAADVLRESGCLHWSASGGG
jgi:hypothetical protein